MKIETFSDVNELLAAYVPSAALGTALESGLFWMLSEQPRTAADVALEMDIPVNRCRYWLDILASLNLLAFDGDTYSPTESARTAILSSYSNVSWSNLAQQWRESMPSVSNLSLHIHEPGSVWAVQGNDPPNYFKQLIKSPERARRFTRMLYEFHQPLADELAAVLNMENVQRLMDLGGGSGVISMALLRRNSNLTSTVVDIENVCIAGREIASENSISDRIDYFPADFLSDELPGGFDLILECDVCVYESVLLSKLHKSLNAEGRLVIVDHFAPSKGAVPPGRPRAWGFLRSLIVPDFTFPTASEVRERIVKTGFRILSETSLPQGWLVIEASVKP
jgi:SAM-dependent methyltransferase